MIQNKTSIKITELEENDLDTVASWAVDERSLIQWCGPVFNFPLTADQLLPWYHESKAENPARLIFKAITDDGKIAGICELGAIDRKFRTASICRVFVVPEYRGLKTAEILIGHVIEHAFNKVNIRRLELNVYTFNSPAIICYMRLGFVKEGLKRKVTQYKDEYWDGYVYGLLKDDWKGL
jgi:RimJ/RimL family protein N-acetyltransferase